MLMLLNNAKLWSHGDFVVLPGCQYFFPFTKAKMHFVFLLTFKTDFKSFFKQTHTFCKAVLDNF